MNAKQAVVLTLIFWWLYRREEVTTSIGFPQAPDGECYDPETAAYYVGDCDAS